MGSHSTLACLQHQALLRLIFILSIQSTKFLFRVLLFIHAQFFFFLFSFSNFSFTQFLCVSIEINFQSVVQEQRIGFNLFGIQMTCSHQTHLPLALFILFFIRSVQFLCNTPRINLEMFWYLCCCFDSFVRM